MRRLPGSTVRVHAMGGPDGHSPRRTSRPPTQYSESRQLDSYLADSSVTSVDSILKINARRAPASLPARRASSGESLLLHRQSWDWRTAAHRHVLLAHTNTGEYRRWQQTEGYSDACECGK